MKLDRLETHDRLLHFTQQSFDIANCCQALINQRPFGDYPFYIFAHTRTIGLDEKISLFNEDLTLSLSDLRYKRKYNGPADVPEKRLIWQPRLTKPKAQTNSMLFKAYPGTDLVKVIWIIPARELWKQYEKGKITESDIIFSSIRDFQTDREKLEAREEDDLSDEVIDAIYKEISRSAKAKESRRI